MDIFILRAGNKYQATEIRIIYNFGFRWGEFNITSVVVARNIPIKAYIKLWVQFN